jgi:hypothetical protein
MGLAGGGNRTGGFDGLKREVGRGHETRLMLEGGGSNEALTRSSEQGGGARFYPM